jgi:hypothetical protein
VLAGLNKKGYACEKLHILSVFKNGVQELINKVNDADVLILSFPLYVDSLPSTVIRALEIIGHSREEKNDNKKQNFISIVNCGFPEAFHNDTALRICKAFADKTDFKWLGGLAMGSGPAIGGKSIEQLGSMTRNIVKALDMTIEAIVNNETIPSKAIQMMSGKLIPTWLYLLFGNQGWKSQARRYNADKNLYEKPYVKD